VDVEPLACFFPSWFGLILNLSESGDEAPLLRRRTSPKIPSLSFQTGANLMKGTQDSHHTTGFIAVHQICQSHVLALKIGDSLVSLRLQQTQSFLPTGSFVGCMAELL
jgi:hypothetical protein